MEELVIDSVTLDDNQGRVTILGVPDTPGIAAHVFDEVANAGIFVDMIVQSFDASEGQASLSFTVAREDVEGAQKVAAKIAEELDCRHVSSSPHAAKLSVSGIGLRSHTSVAIRMFRSLADAGINVEMISTSEVRVNVVVDGSHGATALTELRLAFDMEP